MTKADLDRFWKDDEIARKDNCFFEGAPQMALGIRMSDECVFAELGVEGKPWGHTPRDVRIDLNKRYNDKAEQVVGRRLLRETFPEESARFPSVKRIGEVFGGQYIWANDSEWLESSIRTPEALEKQLDIVDKLDLRSFLLPPNWESEKKRLFETYGVKPMRARHIRGPITLMCSIYGVEDYIFLGVDAPELAERFTASVTDVTIKIAEIMDEEAGFTRETAPHGFSFADDNCCLMTPEMYEKYGYPVLKAVYDRFCPDAGDSRYQHSDSAMAHLLPLLAKTGVNGVNFGPTVLVDEIRKHMPRACIHGCIAPFTFMRNDEAQITAEVIRDFEMAKVTGKGVLFSTAGSINNGSLLSSMRLIMELIQTRCRY